MPKVTVIRPVLTPEQRKERLNDLADAYSRLIGWNVELTWIGDVTEGDVIEVKEVKEECLQTF